jgi:hypothetical protein
VPLRTTSDRIITSLPLREVWDETGVVVATEPEGDLSAHEIRRLLRLGPLHFVVADVGKPPRWVPLEEAFAFWRSEVHPRLADPSANTFDPSLLPDARCYLATRWRWGGGTPLVVLRAFH